MVKDLFAKQTWTVHIHTAHGNRSVDRGNRKRRQDYHKIVIGPNYNEEPALQSRRHEPNTTSSLKASLGATEGVLDYGVPGRPGYVTWAGLVGREDTR